MSTLLAPDASLAARSGRSRGSGAVSGRPRNHARLTLAVLLVVGGGLTFLSLYRSRGRQVPVLVVKRDVPAGHAIADGDLGVAEVAAQGIDTVAATDRPSVIGSGPSGSAKVARVTLKAGSLLAHSQLGDTPALASGDALVVVSLPSDAVPSGLRAELAVKVVFGERSFDGVVYDVRTPGSSSGTSNHAVTVRMKVDDARAVAVAKDVRLVVLPPSESTTEPAP